MAEIYIEVMCRETGKTLTGVESLRQRMADCLSFPKSLLVLARHYGADLMGLIDRNMTPTFAMDAFVSITEAINDPGSGLPDFKLLSLGVSAAGDNWVELTVSGEWAPTGETITLEGVRIGGN